MSQLDWGMVWTGLGCPYFWKHSCDVHFGALCHLQSQLDVLRPSKIMVCHRSWWCKPQVDSEVIIFSDLLNIFKHV